MCEESRIELQSRKNKIVKKCRSLTAEAVRNDERARELYRRNLRLLLRLPKANSYSYASASTGSLRLASHAG